LPVVAVMSRAVCSPASVLRTASVTAAPVPASARAVSMPMPDAAPVTTMRRPVRSMPRATSAAVDSAPVASDDPFAFFEQRVRDHPNDLAARLDLAHRYLDADRVEEALEEYAVALELDPDDAEAHAHIGLILYASHQPEEALASVDRALETAPGYPEALFIRGAILLRGLDRPEEAIEAFEAYLTAAPFGQERGTAQQLIAEAEAAMAEPSAET